MRSFEEILEHIDEAIIGRKKADPYYCQTVRGIWKAREKEQAEFEELM